MDLLGIGAAFGSLLGTDATTGGYIAGAIFLGTMVFIGMVIASHLRGAGSMYGMVTFLAIGIAIPSMFSWFPTWFLVFVLMIVVAMAISSSQGAKLGGD